jgi:hypothetical protein
MQLHSSFVTRSRHSKAKQAAQISKQDFTTRLTPDVLVKIAAASFHNIAEHNSIYGVSTNSVIDTLDTHHSPWTVSQVCRSWRKSVLEAPELWSSIAVDLDRTHSGAGTPRHRRLGLMLTRSNGHPLTLVILNRENRLPNSRDALLDLLIPESQRWFDLTFALKGNLIQSIAPVYGKLALLVKLNVKHTEPVSAQDDRFFQPCNALQIAPMLTDVVQYGFQRILTTLSLPWSQLKSYRTYYGDYLDCLEIMKQAANTMERCDYEENAFAEGKPLAFNGGLIIMYKLTHFRLDLSNSTLDRMAAQLPYFFDHLSFPVIQELRLSWAPHIPYHPSVGEMLLRTGPRIRVLDLQIAMSPFDVTESIRHMIYLNTLCLYWYHEDFVNALSYTPHGTIAPSLTRFQLACPPGKLDAIENMIRSRYHTPMQDRTRPAHLSNVCLLVKRLTNHRFKHWAAMRRLMKEFPGFEICVAETGYFGTRIPDANASWSVLDVDVASDEEMDEEYLSKTGQGSRLRSRGEGSGKGKGRQYAESESEGSSDYSEYSDNDAYGDDDVNMGDG